MSLTPVIIVTKLFPDVIFIFWKYTKPSSVNVVYAVSILFFSAGVSSKYSPVDSNVVAFNIKINFLFLKSSSSMIALRPFV